MQHFPQRCMVGPFLIVLMGSSLMVVTSAAGTSGAEELLAGTAKLRRDGVAIRAFALFAVCCVVRGRLGRGGVTEVASDSVLRAACS